MGTSSPLRATLGAARIVANSVTVTVAVAAAVLGAGASAGAADDPAAAEAKKHYEEGTKAFNLGEYPRAISEFKATYNAKPDPLLLYNIAQSYRLAGDATQALFFYKSFLRNMPGASNRKEVEGRIKVLEKQVAEQKKDGAPAPPVVVPPVATTGSPLEPAAPAAPPAPATAPTIPTPVSPATPSATAVPASPSGPTEPPRTLTASAPADAPPPGLDLSKPALPPEEPSPPIYKRWWFWAGAAALVVVGGATAIGIARAHKAPKTTLGTYMPSGL